MTLVRTIIQEAYIKGQILAETGETASSTELTNGLTLFNEMLNRINIDGFEIPLIEETDTLNLTAGQNFIDLPGWIELEKVQYLQGTVKLNIKLLNLNQYLSTAVITQSSGIPTIGYARRTPLGIRLEIFFNPDQAYQLFINGYKTLSNVTINTDIVIDSVSGFMVDYYKYQLAEDLRNYHQLIPMPYNMAKIRDYIDRFRNKKSIRTDRTNMRPISNQPLTLAAINLSRGYWV